MTENRSHSPSPTSTTQTTQTTQAHTPTEASKPTQAAPASTPVPGPEPRPVIGTLYAMDSHAPIQSSMALASEYGEIFRHRIMGRPPLYMVSSQRLVDELCDESRFDKRVHQPLENIRAFAGDGLFTVHTPEENWGKAHRILMPAFSPFALKGMYDGMADIAEQLMLKWERLGPQADIDVVHDFTRLTLDTIALCSFSYRFNSFYSESMHPFVGAMVDALEESGQRGRRLPIQNRLMLATQRRYDEDIRLMHEVADQVIAHRKAHPLPDGQTDILDTMLSAQDPTTGERLSDENVRYQMVTFLIAGHETTSGLLSFTLYELLKNPDVLEAARAKVDEVLGDRFPTYADLSELGYLDQILRESLRLWPTAPAFGLHSLEPTTIGGRDGGPSYAIEPQDTVLVLTPSLHRDPAVWADPERFDPQRFSFERAQQIPANAWKPFGNGQRSCIGRGFALQEAQLVLALMLQRFDIALADPDYELAIKETLTLKPEGLFARFTVRPGRSADRVSARRPEAEPRANGQAGGETQSAAQTLPPEQQHGTPVRILFGSNAGTSEAFAQQVAQQATRLGYAPRVTSLDEGVDDLPTDGALVVVSASYEGQPPDNAKAFVRWLDEQPDGALDGVRFAVFGCGNTDWARTYQAVPTHLDEALARAGATRLVDRGEANARGDFFGDFDAWHEGLWPAIGEALGIDATPAADAPQLSVDIIGPGREQLLRASDLQLGQIVANRELVDTSVPGARSKRHLEIALPAGQTYETGDYLAVLPLNPVPVIDRALARFDLAYDTRLQLSGAATSLPVDAPVLAGELFGSYVELSRPAGRRQIEQLAAACPCPPEKAQLLALTDESTYSAQVLGKRLSVLDLLERFASIDVSLATYLGMLTPLSPRQYSISSSARWSQDHATLTVAHLSAPALSGEGTYEGVASTFLANARPGAQIPVTVRPSNVDFAPPAGLATPMIMVCAGTGLAPFRGFIQDRALRAQSEGVTPAPALLFFGCDGPDVDYLYRDELAAWEADGIVQVRPAFSAAPQDGPEGPMRFVQDRLWADRADVADLVRAGATLYVCGDGQRMAPAVHDTCVRMYAQATGASEQDAVAWVEQQEREHGRYVSDVFA